MDILQRGTQNENISRSIDFQEQNNLDKLADVHTNRNLTIIIKLKFLISFVLL